MAEHTILLAKLKQFLSPTESVWDRALNGQPEEIQTFFRTYQPDSREDEAIYSYMENLLLDGDSLDTMHLYLAWIGDGPLLEYLFYQHENQADSDIRKSIIENEQCPVPIIEKAMWDSNWEVSKAAINRPEMTLEMCLKRAEDRANPYVVDALNRRLDHFYAQKTSLYAANTIVQGNTEDINILIESASFRSETYEEHHFSEISRKTKQRIEEPLLRGS